MRDTVVCRGDIDLAVRVWGQGSSSVVLVHGYGTNLLSWLPLVRELEDDYTVVAYDRRGHGCSSSAESYAIDDLAEDVTAVLNELELARPILVGHSVGAWDVLAYRASDSNVGGVLCLDQAIAVDDATWQATYRPRSGEDRLVQLAEDPLLTRGYTQAEIDRLLLEAESTPGLQPWSAYGPMLRRGIVQRSDGLHWFRPYLADRVLLEQGWATVVTEPYDAIRCPVTVALAERNNGPFHEALHRLVARRNLRAVPIDADHDVHVEQPGAIGKLVRTLT